jgi:hypothetical protein
MRKFKFFLCAFLIACFVFAALGCASSQKTLSEIDPERMSKTHIGMSFEEFQAVWPEAKKVGEDQNYVIYEYIYTNTLYGGLVYDYRLYERFYFSSNLLQKYDEKSGL